MESVVTIGYIDPISLEKPAEGCGWGEGLASFAGKSITQQLIDAPRSEALGAAIALLLDAADKDPNQLKRILSTPINKDGVNATIQTVLFGDK